MADLLDQTCMLFTPFIFQPLRGLSKCFSPAVVNSISRLLPYVFLGSICYGLDAIFLSVQRRGFYLRALVDNGAHGMIAFVSWCIVTEMRTRKDLMDAILCALIACAIDVDHFIAAKSFRLQVREERVCSKEFEKTITTDVYCKH